MDLRELGSSRLLKGFTDEQLASLGAVAVRTEASPGDYIFRVGDPAHTLYLIKDGLVELVVAVRVLGVTQDVVVAKLTSGDALAWSSLVEPYRLTRAARAHTAVTLYGFERQALLALCEELPTLGFLLMKNLAVIVARRLDLTMTMWFTELERSVSAKYR